MASLLSSPHAVLLEQAISAASLRHKVIADNIANVNTPGFKRSEVHFEDVLREKLEPTTKLSMSATHKKHLARPSHLPSNAPQLHTITDKSVRNDGNNVDVEIEMATMAKNTIYYDATVQQLNRYFTSIKSAIKEGRS